MKTQEHNKTELKELTVNIEKDVVEAFERMADNTGYDINDLVVIALKRFRVSHSDYEGTKVSFE
ncbi:hypothetical protein BIY24_16080 [Halobacteriovorax marinus]|uniref:Uncharacterized protein n=1 Tax=Halobacteriovorax marinus (strain ATCC BAA-682 / DSM 15412 / SJ) TaxID=862908 RepID=E1X173_HALMS|nr:hypothetical protein [Halobacteriovorax marinus]ATH09403.1 hypothetical protein BIY24_16080 [Halobacteriovorax marinus]CBW28143.1 hypothetical protein BMS_3400 [Halobacteriovorax marinus SJ]